MLLTCEYSIPRFDIEFDMYTFNVEESINELFKINL